MHEYGAFKTHSWKQTRASLTLHHSTCRVSGCLVSGCTAYMPTISRYMLCESLAPHVATVAMLPQYCYVPWRHPACETTLHRET